MANNVLCFFCLRCFIDFGSIAYRLRCLSIYATRWACVCVCDVQWIFSPALKCITERKHQQHSFAMLARASLRQSERARIIHWATTTVLHFDCVRIIFRGSRRETAYSMTSSCPIGCVSFILAVWLGQTRTERYSGVSPFIFCFYWPSTYFPNTNKFMWKR